MMKRTLTTLLAATLMLAVADTTNARHGQQECMKPLEDGAYNTLLCPDPTERGASCVSHGVLVIERDISGTGLVGDAVVDLSQSRAWTWAIPSDTLPPIQHQQPPSPPYDPQAHADAQQVGIAYSNSALSLSTSTIFSRCDVVALENPAFGLYTEAYGRAGVEDLSLSILGGLVTLDAEVLDFEMSAFGSLMFFGGSYATAACDVVEATLTPPGLGINFCPAPNTGFGSATVFVELNEEWGGVPNLAGQCVFGGAVVHATIVVPGVTVTDLYIGYVSVAVTGPPCMMPPIWFP